MESYLLTLLIIFAYHTARLFLQAKFTLKDCVYYYNINFLENFVYIKTNIMITDQYHLNVLCGVVVTLFQNIIETTFQALKDYLT